jgi:hypothetical protein
MITPKIFIYQDFYNYYNNPTNFDILTYVINDVYYFYDDTNKKSILYQANLPSTYFEYTIQNLNPIRIYVQFLNNNDILFIKLRNVDGLNYGDHFHIGKSLQPLTNEHRTKINRTSILNKNPIFLHWSLQDVVKKKRNMYTKCTIRDQIEDLNNIDNILCTNRQTKMKDEFDKTNTNINQRSNTIISGLSPNFLNLLSIIKHILRRPFFPLEIERKIYDGPNGGRYIKKNNKKIYLKHKKL